MFIFPSIFSRMLTRSTAKYSFFVAGVLFAHSVFALRVVSTTCEFQSEPLALNTLHPRLGWQLADGGKAAKQSAYELEMKGEKFNWNSGKILSSQNQLLWYAGKNLECGKKYNWRVRIWDTNGVCTEWSQWAIFQTAPDKKMLNDAAWIGAIRADSARLPLGKRFSYLEMGSVEYKSAWKKVDTLSRKSILLRKSFVVRKPIQEAITYICGLGHYELSINGRKAGDSEFAPFWSDYDKTVYYNALNTTSFFRKGENVLGVLLGNGFFNAQGGRYSKLKISFGAPTLFFKTIIRYADNSTEEIVSDQSWRYALSPITFNDIYGGEDYNACLEQAGWDKPGFKASGWKAVVLQQAPEGTLSPQQGDAVKIMERIPFGTLKRLTAAECDSASRKTKRMVDHSALVFDMHQNLAGFPEIRVKGKKGSKITLVVGESVTPEGAVDQRQTGRPHLYVYTLKGGGVETWHPRFAYYSFHYIQVEGAVMTGDANPRQLPVLSDIKSCFVYAANPQVSSFECSNPIFNQTHTLILKAIESNMQSVFTDCPQREKLGWLEQLHLNGPGLMYNFNLSGFIPKIVQDMVDAQLPDGAVPSIAPMYTFFGDKSGKLDDFGVSPEWGSSLIILPWMYYQYYGDSSLIVNNYQSMRRWVDYLGSRANNHVLSFGLGDWYDYGNFRAGFSRNTPVPFVATAYYFYALKYLVKSAEMVGNKYDAAHYSAMAEEVRKVLNTKFFNAETRQYSTGSQTANALAIYMNIVEPGNRQAVLDNLVKDIKAHGNRLTTGDVGNRYLFQTLADNQLNELMFTMFNHEEAPGYGYQLKFGATTLTEQWDPRQGASWNHFMLGQIDEWFFRSLAGIQPDPQCPGMKHFIIKPQPVGDLKFVKASTQTLYGKIDVEWKKEESRFVLQLNIPFNCSADVYLPGQKEPGKVTAGSYQFIVP